MTTLSPSRPRARRILSSSSLLAASILGLSAAHAIPVLPITGTSSNDWHFVATGGRYYQVGDDFPGGGIESSYPFSYETNPFFCTSDSSPRSGLVSLESSTIPGDGGMMLQMNAPQVYASGPSFEAPDGSQWLFAPQFYQISMQIDLDLLVDQTISGFGRFSTTDSPIFGDFSSVTINGDVAWSRTISDVYGGADGDNTGTWDPWTWTAPTSGTYTLSLNLYGDDQMFSSASFGDLAVGSVASNVPEQSSTALLLGFVLVLGVAGNRVFARRARGAASAG